MGGGFAPVPYFLRRGTNGMASRKSGAALKDRNASPSVEYSGKDARQSEEWFPFVRAGGMRRSQLVRYLLKKLYESAAYRLPMPVREYVVYRNTFGTESEYFVCPRCDTTMEREYQAYCDRCGQRLAWKSISRTTQRKSIN